MKYNYKFGINNSKFIIKIVLKVFHFKFFILNKFYKLILVKKGQSLLVIILEGDCLELSF
jgi:hypothetical protein